MTMTDCAYPHDVHGEHDHNVCLDAVTNDDRVRTLQLLRVLTAVDTLLSECGSGRSLIETSKVRDGLLDIRTALLGRDHG